MEKLLPENFICDDRIRADVLEKIGALAAIEEELPVFVIHDLRDLTTVYMSEKGLRALDITLEDVRRMGLEYYTNFFEQDAADFYLPKLLEQIMGAERDKWFSHFQQVVTGPDGSFEWFLSSSRSFVFDQDGKPLLSLTIALQLDPDHHLAEKAERLTAENLMLKANQHAYASLTKREKQLLACIAAGETAEEMVDKLFISAKTLKTHRRNIKRKIGAKTQVDMVKFAQAFNLV